MTRALSLLMLCCTGCALLLPPVKPMVEATDDFTGAAKCLVVFLPGVGDVATDFEDKGFVDSIRQRGLSVDVVSAQATLAYYAEGTMVKRLGEDVLTPQKRARYRQVWLIGLSMGGLGTLLYAHDHPRDITGVLTLAPFLGTPPFTRKIRDAGGLAKWKAPPKVHVKDEDTSILELWRWLQAVTTGREKGPRLYFGYGADDEAVPESNELLAEVLPASRKFKVPGTHAWSAWKLSLDAFLEDSSFRDGCSR